MVRVTVSYDCPNFDCVIKTCNQGTAAPPTFWSMSVVVKQLDGSPCHLVWTMEVYVGPDHIVAAPHKVHSRPPKFWPMSIVAKWLDASKCHLVRR